MQLDESCLLCNPVFHDRFCKTTEVLALVLSAAPFSVGLDEMLDRTSLVPMQLMPICHALRRAGFIRQHEVFATNWVLCTPAADLTLEDVFHCVAHEFGDGQAAPDAGGAVSSSVNAVLMQASIATYQCILRELRRFALARLRVGVSRPAESSPPERNHSLATAEA